MSLKKRASKSIVLALVGVTIVTPMLNTASAMENKVNNTIIGENLLNDDSIPVYESEEEWDASGDDSETVIIKK